MLVIAHRGASAEFPENTLPAFERAIEIGADYVELDVHADAQGRLVVTHDLPRSTRGVWPEPDPAGPLAAGAGATRVTTKGPAHRARSTGNPGTKGSDPGQTPGYALLEEVLELCAGRIGVMVELKRPARYRRFDVVARTVRLLDDDGVLVCFQRPALEEARRLRPGLRTVQHVGFGVSIRRAAGAWAAGFANSRVTPRGLEAARRLGLETTVYTVNDEARMLELRELGVSGIFTDYPDRALATLGRRPGG
jgi:glycerophosphoryl diester phosphodiesterase